MAAVCQAIAKTRQWDYWGGFMYVTFSWPMTLPLGKSAGQVAQAIKDSGRLEEYLLIPQVYVSQDWEPALRGCEILRMHVSGGFSNSVYPMPILGVYNICMWQKIEDVADLLREFIGVEPRILINGNQSVLSYAAQEEARARYFRQALEAARVALKGTRTWLRDWRIASIRQNIDDCFRHETSVELVGYRRVLVEPEP